jgi:hypothetical protein
MFTKPAAHYRLFAQDGIKRGFPIAYARSSSSCLFMGQFPEHLFRDSRADVRLRPLRSLDGPRCR